MARWLALLALLASGCLVNRDLYDQRVDELEQTDDTDDENQASWASELHVQRAS